MRNALVFIVSTHRFCGTLFSWDRVHPFPWTCWQFDFQLRSVSKTELVPWSDSHHPVTIPISLKVHGFNNGVENEAWHTSKTRQTAMHRQESQDFHISATPAQPDVASFRPPLSPRCNERTYSASLMLDTTHFQECPKTIFCRIARKKVLQSSHFNHFFCWSQVNTWVYYLKYLLKF